MPHAAGTEDYADQQRSKRHSHISSAAGKTCDDRQTFLVEDLRQDGIKCPQPPGSAEGKDKCSRIKQTEVCKIQQDQHQRSDADDFKKAPLYKEIGEGPRNVAEYDENIKDVMENPIGKRAPENMDVDTWQKNVDEFLASRK